jgi:ribosomal protein L14E/L6E/L27E
MEMYNRTEEQKMDRWETGMLAKSLAGHDKDKVYVIVGLDEQFTYLADGERKTLQRKRKRNMYSSLENNMRFPKRMM